MAEVDRVRVTAMFTTDTKFNLRTTFATFFNSNLHQLANTSDINRRKGVCFEDSLVGVLVKKRTHVISAHAKSCLSEVIRTKRKEFSGLSYFISCECSTWDFDHGTNEILDLLSRFFLHLFRCFVDDSYLVVKLFLKPD